MNRARSRTPSKAEPTCITGTMTPRALRVRSCRCKARPITRRRRSTFWRFVTWPSRAWRSSVFPLHNSYQTPAGHLPPKKSDQLAVVSLTLLKGGTCTTSRRSARSRFWSAWRCRRRATRKYQHQNQNGTRSLARTALRARTRSRWSSSSRRSLERKTPILPPPPRPRKARSRRAAT